MPPSDRSRVISWGTNRVFIDSFHNNEAGLRSAMDSFLAFDHRPKMAVIGDIPDLGTGSRKGHRDLVEWILGCDLACVVFVGPRFYAVRRRGARFISSAGAYFRWLAKQDIQDTFIMVKGFTRLNLSRPFIRDHTE